MYRAIPTSNKLLAKKWDDHVQELHLSKLKSMRPSIDSSTPPQFRHLRSRLKRQQLLEGTHSLERYTEIERENRILLEKMSMILNTKGREVVTSRPRSLNRELRKRELLRVTAENQAILKRLQEKPASYNVHQWEEDRRRQEDMIRLRCEYPYQSSLSTYRERGSSSAKQRTYTPISRSLQQKTANNRSKTLTPLHQERRTVLKKAVTISGHSLLLEISTDHRYCSHSSVWITASDVEKPDTFSLELTYLEALEIMGGSDQFESIPSALSMENGELVLSNTKAKDETA